jgi:tripartite-type tricarboxylate transporter receptor subunit TctC
MSALRTSAINAPRRALVAFAAGLCGSLALGFKAGAQGWPSKAIRIIVPFPPGGTTDVIARRVQPLLERNLKTTIVIENRGGASGVIGTQAAVAAAPDGTTFLLVFDTHGVNPSLLPNLPYDTLKDLVPIMLIGTSPMVITTHPATAYGSFADVIGAARAKAGAVAYGTIGAGSLAHLAMSQIGNALNVTMTHVPYKGGGPLTTDVLGGHVPLAIGSIALFSPHVKAGALRPLAVTSRKRVAQLPDTPTIGALGVEGFDAESWWGLLAPAWTPTEIVGQMNAAMAQALQEPSVRQGLAEQGVDYRLSSPEAFGVFLDSEIGRWAKVVKDNKIVMSE